MEEIKEKLHEQENEIRLLKELIVKGFKGIENLSFQSQKKFADGSTTNTTAEDSEASRNEPTPDDTTNDTEYQAGPELPLPVPNLF